jgi:DNA-binding PadR family transcriptional regulator
MKDLENKAHKLLPLTEASYYVLVSLIEPRHGYGIMQNVAAISSNQVRLGPGTLYGALTNLRKQGLIERVKERAFAAEVDPQAKPGAPTAAPAAVGGQESENERRKIYALTELGKKVVGLESRRLQALAQIGRQAMKKIGFMPSEE